MDALEQKVRHILKLQFADEEIEFDRDLGTQLLGYIVSDKFEGLDNEARHKMIWTPLRALLTRKERRGILSFLAYTPAEQKLYSQAFDGPPREKLSVEAMKSIERKVKDILKLQFTDEEIRVDDDPGEIISGVIVSEKFGDLEIKSRQELIRNLLHAHLTGVIVSEKFGDLEIKSRQELIRNLLHAHLTPEERRQVAGFQAFTPEEQAVRSEWALAYPD